MKIHIELSGGLGNQLFQVAKAYELSHLFPSTKIKIVWPTFSKTNVAHERLRINEWLGSEVKVTSAPLTEAIHKIQRKVGIGETFFKTFQDAWWYENSNFDIAIKNYQGSIWVRSLFQQKPAEWVLNSFKKMYKETKDLRETFKHKNSYGALHIRLGDYLTNEVALNEILPQHANYYRRVFNRLLLNCNDIFVVTNGTKDQVNKILNNVGSHYEIIDVEDDFYSFSILAGASHLGITNSTFSLWAAYCSDALSVFAPARWMNPALKPVRIANDLYRTGWEVYGEEDLF